MNEGHHNEVFIMDGTEVDHKGPGSILAQTEDGEQPKISHIADLNQVSKLVIKVCAGKDQGKTRCGVAIQRNEDGAVVVTKIVEDGMFSDTDLRIGDEIVIKTLNCR